MTVTAARTRVVLLSDTHGCHWDVTVPDGDVLVHAGDATNAGDLKELRDFERWLSTLPHPHRVVIAGNHDWAFERRPKLARATLASATYLQDSVVELAGLRFYGSPWQPEFCNWAFNLPRGPALAAKWAAIPADVDVLVTHGPPHGVLDQTFDGRGVGCRELRRALDRVTPAVHVFGHIHEARGVAEVGRTLCVNASICDLGYEPSRAPFVVDVEPGGRAQLIGHT